MASSVDAVNTWLPFAPVAFVMSSPETSTANDAGTSIRTLPWSPNAHARNVAKAGPTRTLLPERGWPAGRSNWMRACVVWPKYRSDPSPTVTSRKVLRLALVTGRAVPPRDALRWVASSCTPRLTWL